MSCDDEGGCGHLGGIAGTTAKRPADVFEDVNGSPKRHRTDGETAAAAPVENRPRTSKIGPSVYK
jgi:hypothetical protein